MNNKILSIEKLSVDLYGLGYQAKVLKDVSIDLEKGEMLGIVGESGSGKTLTCLSIVQLLPNISKISSGKIIFESDNLLEKKEDWMRRKIRGKKISMIFQDPTTALDPIYSVQWQMKEALILSGRRMKNKREEKDLLIDSLSKIKIPDAEDVLSKYPHQLSGGMKQRVVIAIALLLKPTLLIADEPTTNLDVTVQHQVLDIIYEEQEKSDMSAILVSHDLHLVSERCKKMVVMYGGMVMEKGETEKILNNPASPYTKSLIACIPPLEGEEANFKPIPGDVINFRNPPKGCPFHPRCLENKEVCAKDVPELFKIDDNHYVNCWLF